MTSSRPYLLRAFYEWIVDNNTTPYVVVNAFYPNVSVPQEYVENGKIVLNISPGAVRGLLLANDHIEFNARFAGIPQDIYVPMRAITAVYAKENGRGMVFKDDEEEDTPPPPVTKTPVKLKGVTGSAKKGKKGGPTLTVVK
jgi:stringent starvation protein B